MKTHAKKLLFLLMMITTFQTHSEIINIDPYSNLSEQFNRYLTSVQENKLLWTGGCAALIMAFHTLHYINDISDKQTIDEQYPHAATWYHSMQEKYPAVHFDTKKLLATDTKQSSFYNIYFQHATLKVINDIYEKKLENIELSNSETLLLQQNEFILLCHAGYIEYNSLFYHKIANLATLIGTELIQVPLLGYIHNLYPINSSIDLLNVIQTFDNHCTLYDLADLFMYIGIIIPMINSFYESQQYIFASQHADIDSLKAVLELYKHNTTYKYEYVKNMILLEIEKREQMPIII